MSVRGSRERLSWLFLEERSHQSCCPQHDFPFFFFFFVLFFFLLFFSFFPPQYATLVLLFFQQHLPLWSGRASVRLPKPQRIRGLVEPSNSQNYGIFYPPFSADSSSVCIVHRHPSGISFLPATVVLPACRYHPRPLLSFALCYHQTPLPEWTT